MKKGDILEGIVKEVRFPNKGIVEAEDRMLTVKNVLPGQKIRFSVTKARPGKGEGRFLEVVERAENEIDSPCPHFGLCGGCTYQNLSYSDQLALKEKQVQDLLKEVCPELPFERIKESPKRTAYRNKMEFSFGDEIKDGPLALGMHKRGSFYDIVTVDQCQIVDEDFRKILRAALEFAREQGLSYYHKLRHTGYWRHLLVRKGSKSGEILVAVVTSSQGNVDMNGLVELFCNLDLEGSLKGILHIINDSQADIVRSDETRLLWGQDYFYEELLGLKFKISPFSFFQTNSLGAEVLYETAREFVGNTKDQVIFDLYSGTGTIAQMLAPVAKKVVGVEIVEEAVEAARVNAELNGLENCEFWAGDVLKVIDELSDKPDMIILDPPRDGIHPKALQKIMEFGVERMVYISCKPTSLARDLVELQKHGYQVRRCCCVDMFPGTGHVETVVLLSHKSPDSVINVKVEFGEGDDKISLDAIAERAKKYQPKPKVTYKMIQEYVEKKYGFKVHTAYIAEVKRSLGLTTYDAPNAVEELKQSRKRPPKEKAEAITEALKYFEVI
jgi:23S rRNA (uracil1939-C5)-methyltransferase